jgi:tRNA/tmRNA/rRNA uracil-C5-methylase (TrmA/RlmC/RlmD family)
MIFVLNEAVMNGTVTMKTIITGVEGSSFEVARAKLKTKLATLSNVTIKEDSAERVAYAISGQMAVWGVMESKELEMLK